MKHKLMVYIAGPYSSPDPVVNTRNALNAWELLVNAGFTPVCPHLSLFTHFLHPHEANFWYEYDLYLLERCDVMLRLPGDSPGADAEELFALQNAITVHKMTAEEFVAAYS